MTVRLRPMRWWHIDAVHRIEREVFDADPWTVEQFWGELAQPTRRYVVACDEDDVIGYAGLFVLPPDADVQTIAVAASGQGRGVGAQLLDSLVAQAAQEGCDQLMLEVRSDNEAAISLYQRHGFEQISVRRDYYAPGVDARIMRLRPIGGHHA